MIDKVKEIVNYIAQEKIEMVKMVDSTPTAFRLGYCKGIIVNIGRTLNEIIKEKDEE